MALISKHEVRDNAEEALYSFHVLRLRQLDGGLLFVWVRPLPFPRDEAPHVPDFLHFVLDLARGKLDASCLGPG